MELKHPMGGSMTINPEEVLDLIAEHAWKNGEPGFQFIDTVNKLHLPYLEKYYEYNTGIETSNPCSEAFLLPYESCLLGAINLYKYIRPFWKGAPGIDTIALVRDVSLAVHFLNKMLDKTVSPLPQIDAMTRDSRKIGLGVMGLADMLSGLCLGYNSEEGRNCVNDIMSLINKTAEETSIASGYKNAMITLIAPTGTTGIVAGVSQGIEPHFRLKYKRNSVKLGELTMYSASLRDYLESTKNRNIDDLDKDKGSFPVGSELQRIWPTADQIAPMDHLLMLATVQKNVHNAVSKTINLPSSATKQNIKELIIQAHKLGVKGFTVYRDGSRESEVLSTLSKNTPVKEVDTTESKRARPGTTTGDTTKASIGCGTLYVTTNSDVDGPCEVFTSLGRSGGCPSQSEATARLISLCLRSGISTDEIVDQLVGIRCLSTLKRGGNGGKLPDGTIVLSCPDAIGKCLKVFSMKDLKAASIEEFKEIPTITTPLRGTQCPKCGANLQMTGGCMACISCGFSKCG